MTIQPVKIFASNPLVTNFAYSCNVFNPSAIFTQSLRWKRKPIWLPTAKSKVFRVPKRPVIPEDEHKEIQRLYNNYRTYIRSIQNYFREINKQNEVQLDQAVIDKQEEDDFNRCMLINDKWNKKIAAERKIRLEQEAEARRLKILESIEEKKKRDKMIVLEVDQKVLEAKMLAPTFITRENIDQAIEEALSNTADYNKALKLDGSWYTDKSGLPPVSENKEERKSQITQ